MDFNRYRPVRRSSLMESRREARKYRRILKKERKIAKAKQVRIGCLENELLFIKEGYPAVEDKLSERFQGIFGHPIDWDNPKSFNEKMQWLKLYDSTELKTRLTDKYAVREWVKEIIGEEYLVPLLGVFDSFRDIDFEKLPERFVMKATHGCEWNIIVNDKNRLDKKQAGKLFEEWLNTNFAFKGFEMQYAGIEPKIIIEQHLGSIGSEKPINDYKVMCYEGKPEYIWVDENRTKADQTRTLYTLDWEKMDIQYDHPSSKEVQSRPESLDTMIKLATKLSEGFNMVRVDFYEVEGRPYFGEMTFTSGNGFLKFYPQAFDEEEGQKIILSGKKTIQLGKNSNE